MTSSTPSILPSADNRGRWLSTQADPRVCLTPSWELRLGPQGASQLRQYFAMGSEGMRGIKLFSNCLWDFFGNNPATRWAIFCPLEDHLIAGVCFLPHGHQSDCRMLLLRSGDRRYYSETRSVFDLLQKRVSSCVEYLHSICECSYPIYMYVSCCFDKNYKVRSERCMNVKPIWCTYLSISSSLSI